DIMGAIRDGRMQVTSELTDLFFKAVDEVRLLLARDRSKIEQERRDFNPIMRRLTQAAAAKTETAPAPSASPAPQPVAAQRRDATRAEPAVPAVARTEAPAASQVERAQAAA